MPLPRRMEGYATLYTLGEGQCFCEDFTCGTSLASLKHWAWPVPPSPHAGHNRSYIPLDRGVSYTHICVEYNHNYIQCKFYMYKYSCSL